MDLAHGAGMHPTYISHVEAGSRNVGVLTVYALATALGATVNDLMSEPV